ncbi:hypothetical protein IAE16_05935 [Hydrogenobacter sp. T-2]|uniref:hypothetical protein n=1 Tax=Pampinifervens diazotrophicum TaxID=1632018 RepID=UPI002B25DDCB|nr:hypothetical protein [Hydrogenobacter sp. T-2]WPM31360.1 hypothetical protein IAE16_05935 [Hydrogenobacter sp. T-2]
MLRDIGLIFLAFRVLLFAFFLGLSIDKSPWEQAIIIIPAGVYLSLGIHMFLYPGKLKLFKSYGDLVFLPLLTLLSDHKEAILALTAPIALYTSRNVFRGMLFLWLFIGLGFYYYGVWGFVLLPVSLTLFMASLHPDLVEALRKERLYVRNLRKSYSKLTSEYARLEKGSQNAFREGLLLDQLIQSKDIYEYLRNLKETYELKMVSITPSKGEFMKKPVVDVDNQRFCVPVRLERGEVNVCFYVNSPMQFYDKELMKTLERAGKLINLYIEGLEERPQTKVIAV